MKKVISSILALTLVVTGCLFGVSAENTVRQETAATVVNDDAVKGAVGNGTFGPKYTVSADAKGVKVTGAADRGAYERVDIHGEWKLDGLRVEMEDVLCKESTLFISLVSAVGDFPEGDGKLAIGLDPASDKLWVSKSGANNLAPADGTGLYEATGDDVTVGAYKTAASKYTMQFDKTGDTWKITLDDSAVYQVPAAEIDALLSDEGKIFLSIVSNPPSTATDKTVAFTVSKLSELVSAPAPSVETHFVPTKAHYDIPNQEPEMGTVFNSVFGGSFELEDAEGGGVTVYGWDDRAEYERINIGGKWNMDGFRMEIKDADCASPIMLGLVGGYGSFPTPAENGTAFGMNFEGSALRITNAAENLEPAEDELYKPVRQSGDPGKYRTEKSGYSIQFNKLENGKWMVTIDDCAQYEFDESVFGSAVNLEEAILVVTCNPKTNEANFTFSSFDLEVAAPTVTHDSKYDEGTSKPTEPEKPDDKPVTGVEFPIAAVALAAAGGMVIVISRKRK